MSDLSVSFTKVPEGHVDRFLDKAKSLVAKNLRESDKDLGVYIPDEDDFYVVWFCKTLGNWKALVSTDIVDDSYYEVTHDGAKNVTYVDEYKKVGNTAYPDYI